MNVQSVIWNLKESAMTNIPVEPSPSPKNPAIRIVSILIISFILLIAVPTAYAEWREAGVRMGLQAGPKREYFHLYEAFGVYGLPWDWRAASGWGVSPQLSTSAGALVGGQETGFIGSIGTGLVFDKNGKGGAVEAGLNIDLLDKRQFGHQDFGSVLLWGAYIGLSYRFASGLGVGYRLQHLSNNRILYSSKIPNPGADLHMIGVSWHF
ncbi:MAG: acyloxyacyl hydrolase [Deltaproteobacteria bacterium]|nr:acyloxyacyl hydrolase [Deltaproteobacteria bacterium]